MDKLFERMIRAAKLDVDLYEEVEADKSTMGQAVLVVIISNLAAGLGRFGELDLAGIVIFTVLSLAGWFIWAYITYIVGTKLLPQPQTKTDHGELLRTIGFSSCPGVLRAFYFIPVVGVIITFIAIVWMLVTMIIAVRQALDYDSTLRAVGVCIIGWIIQWFFVLLLSSFFDITIMQ
ncbi:MAG: hypothetical protein GWO07_04225 [Candidatus Dadabacteria bacterium]|nr:hypothetical protein [Candidatus Dadabacteria bacterium]NIS07971.1 hypothetical protein [Candidatus Dadabacteria bacterium]NIV43092.1 hypothetical protein [Candidatus Dadabacteria bacterium]NIX14929.1 hypothetical protein [Candidatus Dadabacteria bacterium]NIY21555.1 hypothetical protein [Candidatus Dadabacteria bacterium]